MQEYTHGCFREIVFIYPNGLLNKINNVVFTRQAAIPIETAYITGQDRTSKAKSLEAKTSCFP